MDIENIIVLIDDDEDDRQMLDHTIKGIDGYHKILKAENGAEGLEVLNQLITKKTLPCLIILDLNMPKMDGKQTFLAIKADSQLKNIPVTIFSTSSSETDQSFFKKYNTPYFVKPVKEKELSIIAADILKYCSHYH